MESDQIITRTEQAQAGKPCGHAHHVGTCPSCQRAQLKRWRMQLVQAGAERSASRA
jgi:hypothetical protein